MRQWGILCILTVSSLECTPADTSLSRFTQNGTCTYELVRMSLEESLKVQSGLHLGLFGFKGYLSSGTFGESLLCPMTTLVPYQADRQSLRRLLRHKRNALSPAQQAASAQGVYRQLAQHAWFRRARNIALYVSHDGEISPHLLLQEAQRRNRNVYLPVLSCWPAQHMVFQRITAATRWRKNRFGIVEPVPDIGQQRRLWTLDLVCLPLVGFDAGGGRLGMGGGFYDRSLAACNLPLPPLLGLAHSCQQVERLPLEPWDMPLDAVVTERAWHACT